MKCKTTVYAIAATMLTLGMALAQNDRPEKGGKERRGGGGRGAARVLRFDTNGDTLVEEAELRAGLTKLQADAGKAVQAVMKGFDDGDGKLSETEGKALQEAIDTLSEVRRADRDGNWQLEDEEMSRLWERSSEMCQQHNEEVLGTFDLDKDGKLNEQEAAAALAASKTRGGRGGGERGQRGGGERRGGGGRERGEDRRPKNDDRR